MHSTFAAGHQMAVGSPHMAGVGPGTGGMSNSPMTSIQPSTPRKLRLCNWLCTEKLVNVSENPSSVQPGSVGPGSQQPASVPSQEENTKEYNDLVSLL